jgi:hypothetical protein
MRRKCGNPSQKRSKTVKLQIFDKSADICIRKKISGRPETGANTDRITISLDDEELKLLKDYYQINNLKDKSEAIRVAIKLLVDR